MIKTVSPKDFGLLKSCWKEITDNKFPKTNSEWINRYCNDFTTQQDMYLTNNMVNDCFIRKFVKKEVKRLKHGNSTNTNKTLSEGMDKILEGILGDGYEMKPSMEVSAFYSCLEFNTDDYKDSLQEYFETVYDLNDMYRVKVPNRLYCNDTKKLDPLIKNLTMIERDRPENITVVKKCWSEMVHKREFPTSKQDWKDYLCDGQIDFPVALAMEVVHCIRSEVDYETFEKQNPNFSIEAIIKHITDDEKDVYYSLWTHDIKNYNQICLEGNMTALRTREEDKEFECAVKEFTGRSTTSSAIDYCWKLLLSRGEFFYSKGIKDLPRTENDWHEFYCSHEYYNQRRALTDVSEATECLENMITLDSRFSFKSGKETVVTVPERSASERRLMKCLNQQDIPENKDESDKTMESNAEAAVTD